MMMVFDGRTRSESTAVLYACYYLSGKQWYVHPIIFGCSFILYIYLSIYIYLYLYIYISSRTFDMLETCTFAAAFTFTST